MTIDPMMALQFGTALMSGFGGGNEPPHAAQVAAKRLMRAGREAWRYGNGIPGSSPQELAALAQAKGLAGERQAASNNQMAANFGMAMGTMDGGAMGDFMGNVAADQGAQMAGIENDHLQRSIAERFRMKYQVAPGLFQQGGNMALGAAGAGAQAGGGGGDLAGAFGQLARDLAYQKALKKRESTGAPAGGGGTVNGVDYTRNNNVGRV